MKCIVNFIKWALNRFAPKHDEIDFWPFPAEKQSVKTTLPIEKKKPALKKATTRPKKTVSTKKATVVKKATTKKK
jgi:hypothetical protein